jgi:SAM-dependent methyltransferase
MYNIAMNCAPMTFTDVVNRQPPQPWIDGEKIPWNEPGFSQRMLAEHLSQAHNAASRRFGLIDQHVAWIHQHVLGGRPARILDLGCGPGLYLNRLAQLGHRGTGIDFSPASIAYARATAETAGLAAQYRLDDLRTAEYSGPSDPPYDLALLLYGEFNTFRLGDAQAILRKAHGALRAGGFLLLEPSTFASIHALGTPRPSWYAAQAGLWSDRPHIVLQDNAWDSEQSIAVERYTIVDAGTGALVQHAMTTRAFEEDELAHLLGDAGFAGITTYPSLLGHADDEHAGFYAVLAQKSS